MNVFYLHPLPKVAASMHCDKHVGKMLVETCQLLATAHHVYGNGHAVTYKPTHQNHPSAIWCRQSRLHYSYLVDLALGLGQEFYKRYGKHHKSHGVLVDQLLQPPTAMYSLPLIWRTPLLAMPDEFKCDDALTAYRNYYASKIDKMPMVWYKGERHPPLWLSDIWNARMSNMEAI